MIQNFLPQTKINECHFQGLEKDHRLISEEVTGLRSQLERARAEKENVEEALSEAQVMLAQEQREHRSLAQSRAREAELWTDEREKSLSLVEEMTKEVTKKAEKAENKNAASHSNNNARPSSYLQMYCCGFISG